ncbi:MAG: 2-C-methyl-D-erythritol 2,4-cyclodiphosphate synthase [Planctomycetaceae bacterium]|nr:2-C-methyl-D-erythritol 2,4-cyclodiphosphate synthase [Planctomycetaceae bacterium]
MNRTIRIGEGHDTHRTIVGRPLILGGIHVSDAEFGLDGHSDADVLLHAIIDALLGASGRGDIGEWFPNTDERWRNADSGRLLEHVWNSLRDAGWTLLNLDCTIHAERPRMLLWKPRIRTRLSELLQVEEERINVKAKSGEHVGPVGRGEAICANASVLLERSSEIRTS